MTASNRTPKNTTHHGHPGRGVPLSVWRGDKNHRSETFDSQSAFTPEMQVRFAPMIAAMIALGRDGQDAPSQPAQHAASAQHEQARSQSAPRPKSLSISQWSNYSWKQDLHTFFTLYGHVGSNDPNRRCSNRTYDWRREVLTSTIEELCRAVRGVRCLAQVKPRYIPQILDIWSEIQPNGKPRQAPATQVSNFSVLTRAQN
jgi:hypothetical protein